MKKNLFGVGLVLLLSSILILSSCTQQNTPSAPEPTYYYESGILSTATLQTIVAPYSNKTDLTFNDIKTVRNKIRACSLEGFSSEKDVSRETCHNFLSQHGCTPSEADTIIESINDVGNAILFFSVKNSNIKTAYIYAEKQ